MSVTEGSRGSADAFGGYDEVEMVDIAESMDEVRGIAPRRSGVMEVEVLGDPGRVGVL